MINGPGSDSKLYVSLSTTVRGHVETYVKICFDWTRSSNQTASRPCISMSALRLNVKISRTYIATPPHRTVTAVSHVRCRETIDQY